MSAIVDEAKKIFDGDLSITQKDYIRFMKSLGRLKDNDKVKLAELLLSKVSLSPKFITVKDLEVFEKILPLWQLTNNLTDALCISEHNYKKQPIFSDNEVAQKVASILNLVNRNEYSVICALLNNGFGDKEYLKKYIDTLDVKIFNHSTKWKSLYTKAINYCSKE